MDLKEFTALAGNDHIKQTENVCFKISQSIFKIIDKYQQSEDDFHKYNQILQNREAIESFGVQIKTLQNHHDFRIDVKPPQ